MSLITRCPACKTMFKVVTDQLRVSGGWVRCGHCAEVFDASVNLQSLPESPFTPGAPSGISVPRADHVIPASIPEPSALGLQRAAVPASDDADQIIATASIVDSGLSAALSPDVIADGQSPPSRPAVSFEGQLSDAGTESDLVRDGSYQSDFDPEFGKQEASSGPLPEAELPGQVAGNPSAPIGGLDGEQGDADAGVAASKLPATAAVPDASDDVSFVREAIRKQFWRKPAIRILLGLLGLLLALVLLLQVVLHQRDVIAALEPRLKPALQALCVEVRCELAPLKRIDVLVIESSSFSKLNADSYRLSFNIKNSGPLAVAIPSLEVTLTDTQEKPVLRRVISPAQFGAVNAILPAGSDFAGLVAFQISDSEGGGAAATVGPTRVAGYRVLAFYP